MFYLYGMYVLTAPLHTSTYGQINISFIICHTIRVISSPSISTIGFVTLIRLDDESVAKHTY